MAFWSSQRLEKNLNRIVGHNELDKVDCNAITMRVGGEAYVTPGLEDPAPSSHTKQLLSIKGPIAIPPGRFAFLLTEESVTIPPDVMGFISIKATFKSKGLVNVSGFHVDPGWSGPLVFAVFNAGPAPIHLERGMDLFLLWVADLDEASNKRKTKPGHTGIPPSMINNLSGVVDSVYALEARMNSKLDALGKKDDDFRDSLAEMRERQTRLLTYFAIAAVVGGAVVGAAVKGIGDYILPPKPAPNAVLVPIAGLSPLAVAPASTPPGPVTIPIAPAALTSRSSTPALPAPAAGAPPAASNPRVGPTPAKPAVPEALKP